MSAFPAVILLQVIYVHSATAQQNPYFVGYMVNQIYENPYSSTLFQSQSVLGFSAQVNSPGIYSEFRVPIEGIYWISLRPMDVTSMYYVNVDEMIVATAESPQRRNGAVGFARFLQARSVVRVTRSSYTPIVTYEQLTYVDSIFSIALLWRLSEVNAESIFWTAKYNETVLDAAVLIASQRAVFFHDDGVAADRRSRSFNWYFITVTDSVYWISIRAVPDFTMTRGKVSVEVVAGGVPQLIFTTWVKDGLGSYVSRPVFLRGNMMVTVLATYTERGNRRIGFTQDTMVSLVPLRPVAEYPWVVADFPEPPPRERYKGTGKIGRDIDGQMSPSYPERQDASNYKLRRSLHPHLSGIDRQRRSGEELCQQVVQFGRIRHDPQGLVQNGNSTIIIRRSGLYLISLRNDPMSIPHDTTSVMQVFCESSGLRKQLLRVTCFPPPDTSLPEGADTAYYLQSGDRLWVEQSDRRGTDYGTIWSIALVR